MDPHMADYDNDPNGPKRPAPDWVEVVVIGVIILACLAVLVATL